MASAAMMVACLVVAAGPAPADASYINKRSFQIPITLNDARRAEIQQVLLFVQSRDGARWEQAGAVPSDRSREGFVFTAPEDGEYVFKVGVIGRDGTRDPIDIYEAPVGKRIVVDTVPPVVRVVAAERQGDEVTVRWEVVEEHPDPTSVKVEYRTQDGPGGLWTPASVASPESKKTTFRVSGAGPLAVRVQVQDRARNVSAWAEAPVVPAASGTASLPPIPPPLGTPEKLSPEVAPVPPVPGAGDGSWSPKPPGAATRLVSTVTPPAHPGPNGPDRELLPGAGGTTDRNPVVASAGGGPAPGGAASAVPRPGRGGLPKLELVNSRQITLEYEVSKFGPSGVGSVELYVTRDDGNSWERSGEEKNLPAPVLNDPKGPPSILRRSLTVDLPGDGVYGFYLVVKSGAGLGKPPPRNGDLPQMRVEVDTSAPEAQLFRPEPDPARRDALVLRWSAKDNNLGPAPVTLKWSERKNGPWETIGTDLPHSGPYGQHVWQVPATVPHHVYLCLEVRDAAGNIARAVTPEPVLVDLHEPEVQSLRLGSSK